MKIKLLNVKNKPGNIKGYIFDYGATLDTPGHHWGKILWHNYEKAKVPVSEEQFREAYVHAERTLGKENIISADTTFRDTLDIKIKMQLDYLADHDMLKGEEVLRVKEYHEAILHDSYLQTLRTIEHSKEVLKHLQDNGYPMVLVSNFYGNVETVLREMGLDSFFTKVIESAQVGIRKPDPRIYALGVEALNLPAEQILVVGDGFDKDILPAQSLGCKTAWIKGEAWKNVDWDETIPDMIISDISEIL